MANEASAVNAALNSIREEQLRRHVEVLADDAFEGREAGKRGGRAASTYLMTRLDEMGLKGAGDDGGYVQAFGNGYRNILAYLPGSDAKLRSEAIVLGAHYDHVGYGGRGTTRGRMGYIHNGADDNASGTSALLEIAEAITMLPQAPKRTILIAFWDAEEKGLLGSRHWVNNPTIPLAKIRCVINADMIGKLRNERLVVYGTRSAAGFRSMVAEANQSSNLSLDFAWWINPRSDHYSFFKKKIPVLMFHTDLHKDYHRPSDDVEGLSFDGINRITRLMFETTMSLANKEELPKFRALATREGKLSRQSYEAESNAPASRFGVSWLTDQDDVDKQSPGVLINRVVEGSAAAAATIRPGDQLLTFDHVDVTSGTMLRRLVHAAGEKVAVRVNRNGKVLPLQVKLKGKMIRIGIAWRQNDAEPGCVALVRVEPESPAAIAGLKRSDRIVRVNGREFADSAEFDSYTKSLGSPLTFTVERQGRFHTIKVIPNQSKDGESIAQP